MGNFFLEFFIKFKMVCCYIFLNFFCKVMAYPWNFSKLFFRGFSDIPCKSIYILRCPSVCPYPEGIIALYFKDVGNIIKNLCNLLIFHDAMLGLPIAEMIFGAFIPRYRDSLINRI